FPHRRRPPRDPSKAQVADASGDWRHPGDAPPGRRLHHGLAGRAYRTELLALYAVSCFITAALLIFGLILTRSIVRLWAERSKEQLGARFKTKMVLGAMAISLLPVIFMFFVSYSLLNRTLGRWFPRPLEIASEETQKLLNDLGRNTLPRLHMLGYQAATHWGESQDAFL